MRNKIELYFISIDVLIWSPSFLLRQCIWVFSLLGNPSDDQTHPFRYMKNFVLLSQPFLDMVTFIFNDLVLNKVGLLLISPTIREFREWWSQSLVIGVNIP